MFGVYGLDSPFFLINVFATPIIGDFIADQPLVFAQHVDTGIARGSNKPCGRITRQSRFWPVPKGLLTRILKSVFRPLQITKGAQKRRQNPWAGGYQMSRKRRRLGSR